MSDYEILQAEQIDAMKRELERMKEEILARDKRIYYLTLQLNELQNLMHMKYKRENYPRTPDALL